MTTGNDGTVSGRIRLYSGPLSMFGAKAEIAALEKGLDVEVVMVPFEDGYDPKHPDVVRINPKRQVPVLIHGDLEIFDSTQIFEYFEDVRPTPPLWPRPLHDPQERARARLLELKSDEIFFPHVIRLMGLEDTPDAPAALTAKAACADFYRFIEGVLGSREFLAGPFTYADIAFYMAQLFGERKGAPLTAETPRLLAWRERMTARPAVRAVVGPMIRFLASRNRPVPQHWRHLAD